MGATFINLSLLVETEEQTRTLGHKLGELLEPGDVVILTGELGAGKTRLVKALAAALRIPAESVTSPTFTLINEYGGVVPLYHFDVYRLERPEEFEGLGPEEYFEGDGICVIEWGDRIRPFLPEDFLEVNLTKAGETTRRVQIVPHGAAYHSVVERLADKWENAVLET